jgi:drug/metabolite transporter (DMT)-like permease
LIGGLALLPFALVNYTPGSNHLNQSFWAAVLWLAIPVSILAVQLWLWLLKTNAVNAGLWLFLCPLFGFAISGWLMKEPISMYTAAGIVFVIAGLCSLGLPGFSGFVAEMTVFMGSWQNPDKWYRLATILACASIVVTAVYILRATGQTIMGPISNTYETLTDAKWNEKLAAGILITGIVVIGVAPFLINQLIAPGTDVIMNKVLGAGR